MKKLKLNELNLGNAQMLNREQLKQVFGGKNLPLSGDGCTMCCSNYFPEIGCGSCGQHGLANPCPTNYHEEICIC